MIELRWACNSAGDKVLQYRAVPLIMTTVPNPWLGVREPEWKDVPNVYVDFPSMETPES